MRAAVPIVAAWVLLVAGCSKQAAPSETPDEAESTPTPTPTPTAGSGRVGGKATRTGAGDYDDDWGDTKDPINIVIDNQCSSTVLLFFGAEPRPGANYYTSMNGSSQQSVMMMPGDRAWIIDEGENGIASADIDLNSREIVVDSSCEDIFAR